MDILDMQFVHIAKPIRGKNGKPYLVCVGCQRLILVTADSVLKCNYCGALYQRDDLVEKDD